LCNVGRFASVQGMSTSTPLQLVPEDKLDILRYLDEFHFWHSLDDERRCQGCGKSITGRQILIIELQGTRGKLRLQCPTAGCISSPSEWVYANPVLAAKLRRDFHPSAQKLDGEFEARQRAHHGHACTVRPVKRVVQNCDDVTPGRTSAPHLPAASFRSVLGRLAILRPIATGLRAIHPLA
jgi:hypothetical protein